MPAFSLNDCNVLFIGAAANITTGRPSTLNDGEIGIFTPSGTRMTEALAATESEFVIMEGRASTETQLTSGTIKKANIKAAKRHVYTAATEQIDYIGYNGTSGALEAIDDNMYRVRLNMDQTLASNHGGQYLKFGVYISPMSGTTQANVAYGIVDNLIKNFSREPEQQIKFERVHDNAGVANTITAGADATHYKFTLGSKFVVGTDSAGIAMNGSDEVVATTVAGDYLRVGTAVTDPVYKIVAVTAGTGTTPAGTPMIIELDTPYQGTTTQIAIGSTEYITAALAAAGNFGIKLTAVPLTWNLPKIHYRKSKWFTTIDNFGTATITNSVKSTPGNGTYQQIAEREWFLQGNEGEYLRLGYPMTFTPRAETDLTTGYDIITIEVSDEQVGTISRSNAKKVYTIALPATAPNYAVTGTADDITDVLEVLAFGSANGNLAIS